GRLGRRGQWLHAGRELGPAGQDPARARSAAEGRGRLRAQRRLPLRQHTLRALPGRPHAVPQGGPAGPEVLRPGEAGEGRVTIMRFKNKVALITAAANGIGRATAQIMAGEGATVIAVDNHDGRLAEATLALAALAAKSGGKVEGKLVDALD